MARIQTYDRQVLPNVVRDDTAREGMMQVADMALQVRDRQVKQQQAKMNNELADINIQMSRAFSDWKVKYQGNPDSEEADKELTNTYQKISSQYGKDLAYENNILWGQEVEGLRQQYSLNKETWAVKQNSVNAEVNLQGSIAKNLDMAYESGKQGDLVKGLADFGSSYKRLQGYGNDTLGEVSTEQALKAYEADYMKSYIDGVASVDPDKALAMLKDETVADSLGDERDVKELEDIISVAKVKQNKASKIEIAQNEENILDNVVDNPQVGELQKRNAIDKMELTGGISSTFASNARKYLKSKKAIDAVTSSEDMADVITRVYDLNANQSMNNEDYLTGIQNIRNEILSLRTQGKLSQEDEGSLNRQIKTLTASKVAESTKNVSYNFIGATDVFESLPPEYRGEATRELFYQTLDKNMSDDGYSSTANKIVDKINNQRRVNTINTLNEVYKERDELSLDEFVKLRGFTMEDVKQTMKEENLSEQEVIMILGRNG